MSLLRPHLQLHSVLELQASRLRDMGLSTLLLDVDCTLKDYRSLTLSSGVPAWIESLLAAGIQLCLVSNGRRHRIEPLARQYGLGCVARAFKPLPFGCWGAIRQLKAAPARTAMVGDQLFADVLAGRMAGLFTILVTPTTNIEPWFTRLKRPLERRMLAWMNSRREIPTLPLPAEINGVT
jgi:uncharacterized protein